MRFLFSISVLLVPVIAYKFFYSQIRKSPYSIVMIIFLIFLIWNPLFSIGKNVYENYEQPPKWDFLCFWLDGKVALSGENFYEAKNFQEMPLPYEVGDDFRKEFLDVGFRYPPFTMFLFLPLGLFSFNNAFLFWQTLNILLTFACIYGLWRVFLIDDGALSMLLIAVLIFRLSPVSSTLHFSQTNILILFFFLLFWQNRTKDWSGVWLALCVAVKPIMAIIFLYPLLNGKWKTLVVAALTLFLLSLLSVLAFGKDVFISYLFNNPVPNIPISDYVEIVNQSLLAVILRSNQNQIINGSPLMNPLYLSISALLLFITSWVALKKNRDQDWVILSIVFLALIIYPGSLVSYSVFLIIPVVLLLQNSSEPVIEKVAKIFVILVIYFFSGYDSSKYVFFANLFTWLVCINMAAKLNLISLAHLIAKPKPQKG